MQCTRSNYLVMPEGLMNKVSKDLDVMIIGAAIVDLPLRPVSKEVFDVVSGRRNCNDDRRRCA